MHIWLFSPFSPLPAPGTPESRTTTLAGVLAEQGHTVTWFSSDFDHRRKQTVGEALRDSLLLQDSAARSAAPTVLIPTPPYSKNISLKRFFSHRTWGNRLVRIARKKVQSGELSPPDLILASSPPLDAPRAAFALQKQFDCKVYLDLTDLWPHSFSSIPIPPPADKLLSPLLHLLLRRAHAQWRRADGISAMSQEYLDEVIRIAPNQNTHLCYIGGKLLRQSAVGSEPSATHPDSTTQPLNLSTTFLYLGALTNSYDFDTLFAAAELLTTEGHGFHIHIAGSGPEEERLKREVGNLKLEDRVTYHGFLDQEAMNSLCADCQVGLNIIRPGLHITMPHKLNDYLCAGLPVINSLKGEAETLLNTYQAGITYEAGNPQSLARAMRTTLDQGKKNAPLNGAKTLAEALLDRKRTYPEWAEWISRR